jgi:RluA family pseudouridine synthase
MNGADPTQGSPRILNIAAYKFVDLDDLSARRIRIRGLASECALRGTILLSSEGVNMFLAGTQEGVEKFLSSLGEDPQLTALEVKRSWTDYQPFNRMLVRLKTEIIAFGVESVDPRQRTSPKLNAGELKQWLDEGRKVHLLDVRNDYEVNVGTFDAAHPIGVDHFRDFPAAVEALPAEWREEPVVMFCTGGIRCEKAGPFMEQQGFEQVFQLNGGILKYFEEVGGAHYDGDCFVFDQRVAVNTDLVETDVKQCFVCQNVLTLEEQKSEMYVEGGSCPDCYESPEVVALRLRQEHQEQLAAVTSPLPGSIPYDNVRPICVPKKFDHATLLDCLDGVQSHVGRDVWESLCLQERIRFNDQPVTPDRHVRAGERYENWIPMTTEPDVATHVEILDEDEAIIVVDKPAPLPVHPSGRYNRNTLVYWLNQVYAPQVVRVGHRLDANTSGVMLLTRQRWAASVVQPMFGRGEAKKVYLARVLGTCADDEFICEAPISREPNKGGFRRIETGGLESRTEFRVLERLNDGTTLLQVEPKTGRTNQIRLHCWHLGVPILGDTAYLPDHQFGQRQTLLPSDPPMCLHAWKLGLNHPVSNEPREWEAPRPDWAK